jgi:hypothetical protein
MATSNTTLSTTWALLVTAGDEFLVTCPTTAATEIELAISDTETAPAAGLIGHRLITEQKEGMSRPLIGPGYVYARAIGGPCTIALSTWTP